MAAIATLTEVVEKLSGTNEGIKTTNEGINRLTALIQKDLQERSRGAGDAEEARRRTSTAGAAPTSSAGGVAKSFGASAGAIGGGLAGLGAGIAGFMASLAVGSVGLSWLGNDYSGLGDAFASFSSAITKLSPAAMIAIGGAAVIAAKTSSFKNLYGLGTASGMFGLGAGITGLMAGLSIGDKLLSWMGTDFSNLGAALASFSDAIVNLTIPAMTILGGIAAVAIANTAFKGSPISLASNMTAIAAGIAGFLGGLVLTDIGLSWLTDISGADGAGLKSALEMFNNSVSVLSVPAITALGALIGASTLIKGQSSLKLGLNMMAMSAGIAGFLGGLVLADIGLEWLANTTGINSGGLVAAFQLFNDSVGILTPTAIVALGGLLLAASKIKGSPTRLAKNMIAMSAGIAGFMSGLVLADKGISWINAIPSGSSAGILSSFKMFNDLVMALDPAAITALGVLLAASAAFGTAAAGGIVVGMTAMGAGIAGFMGSLAAGDTITKLLAMVSGGEPGEGIKQLFTNIFAGVAEAGKLGDFDLINIGLGIGAIGTGLAVFAVGTFATGLSNAVGAIGKFFGVESAFSQIMQIADRADDLSKGADALDKISKAMMSFGGLKLDLARFDITGLAKDLGNALPFLHALAKGGLVKGTDGWFTEGFTFPDGGIFSPELRLDEMGAAIGKVKSALSGIVKDDTANIGGGSGGGNVINNYNTYYNTNANNNSTNVSGNKNGSGGTKTAPPSRNDVQYWGPPQGR